MFLEPPLKAAITTWLQCSLSKPTTFVIFSSRHTNTQEPTVLFQQGREGWLPCSSSFEVFNSSFVICSSTLIASISVLAQQLHSQGLIFSCGSGPLSSIWGTVGFDLNSEMLTKLNSFSLVLSSGQFRLRCHWGGVWASEPVPVCTGALWAVFVKYRKCIKERRVQLEPLLLGFAPFPSSLLPPPPLQAPAFNFQKHWNCLVWFQELGCHSPWWWLCWRQ